MCDLDVIGTPSKLNVIRKPVVSESQDNPSFEVLSERHTTVVGRVDVVCYSSIKRELKTRSIYECRCDERLKTKSEKSTRLGYTGLLGELEHLKMETRLIDVMFASVMGEFVFLK